MLGLGLSIPEIAVRAWAGGWSPASLFAGGVEGAWYDPSDLSTLWQDAAGTVPVISNGDPVGLMLDKSGNGRHASQVTSSRRPTWRTDGALCWLESDGVDDFLTTGTITLTDQMLISHGMCLTGAQSSFGGPYRFLRLGGNPNSNNDDLLEECAYQVTENRQVLSYYPVWPVIIRDDAVGRPPRPAPHVSWLSRDATSSRTGVLYAGTAIADVSAYRSTPFGGGGTLHLFVGYNASIMRGRIFGWLYLGRAPTIAERDKVNGWMMARSGVSL